MQPRELIDAVGALAVVGLALWTLWRKLRRPADCSDQGCSKCAEQQPAAIPTSRLSIGRDRKP